ncbi:hypothetical protein [Dielma fastidiosa]|uniref:hypothetical protein n=1 Tax=Dielma fastidiosa TaxID=1034346 RepID=UPI0035671CDD
MKKPFKMSDVKNINLNKVSLQEEPLSKDIDYTEFLKPYKEWSDETRALYKKIVEQENKIYKSKGGKGTVIGCGKMTIPIVLNEDKEKE